VPTPAKKDNLQASRPDRKRSPRVISGNPKRKTLTALTGTPEYQCKRHQAGKGERNYVFPGREKGAVTTVIEEGGFLSGFFFGTFCFAPWPSKKKVRRFLAGYLCYRPAGDFFCCFSWGHSKEKQSGEAVLQISFSIVLIFKNKRSIFHLLFCNISTKCPPRPIEKCNCTACMARDI